MLRDDDSPTVGEAAAALARSRQDLSVAWSNLGAMADAGYVPNAVEQCAWNALVRNQIRLEIDLLTSVAALDPEANVDGVPLPDAIDAMRRNQSIGDYARECSTELRGASAGFGAGFGEPITLTVLGVVVAVSAVVLTAAVVAIRWMDLNAQQERTAQARENVTAQRQCLEAGGPAEQCARINVVPPPPPPDRLPGWAKGLIAAGAVVGGLALVFGVVLPMVRDRQLARRAA